MTRRAVVTSVGAYLPARVVTNAELEKTIDTNDAWIVERTGIRQRHIAAEGEFTSHLGAKAALQALERAGLKASDIDLLICATSTPDDTVPATATKIQHAIGMTGGAAFDINAACSGFVYALAMADSFITAGHAKRALVIGAETFSRIVDWSDRSTCILFGDGAGAVVVEAAEGKGDVSDRGILFHKLYSDGQYYSFLHTKGGISSTRSAGLLTMAGKEVFRHAATKMAAVVEQGLEALQLDRKAISWVIPHQANIRILQSVGKLLQVDESHVVATMDRYGNTSAATIPLALAQIYEEGKIERGQILVMPAMGAGFTWGACILRW